MKKKVAVIGAGIGGMAAAYDLALSGCDVTIFEKESFPGGLAAGFKKNNWEWSLEKYYHHWFEKDKSILSLINELGLVENVIFHRPKTVVYFQRDFYPLDSPMAALKYPGFSFADKVRFGLVTVYLRYLAGWKPLERVTAHKWMKKYYGETVYEQLFEPLLIGKFSSFYQEVNMAWFWARFKARSTRLGTYRGGFQAFLDDFANQLISKDARFRYDISITRIAPTVDKKISLQIGNQKETFDQVLATVAPGILAHLAPDLEKKYREKINNLKGIGAVMLIFSLKHPLSKEKYYWYNLPKSAGFPFLAFVEHTNFVSKEYFNNEHLVYCGDYLESSHEYFSLTKNQLIDRFIPGLKQINPDFNSTWVNDSWLYRTPFAQPVPSINHSENILDIRTPIENLYLASMSQVYPWDRGTNFAVEMARRAVELMKSDW
jgi:protoporphyrinogen oxidase